MLKSTQSSALHLSTYSIFKQRSALQLSNYPFFNRGQLLIYPLIPNKIEDSTSFIHLPLVQIKYSTHLFIIDYQNRGQLFIYPLIPYKIEDRTSYIQLPIVKIEDSLSFNNLSLIQIEDSTSSIPFSIIQIEDRTLIHLSMIQRGQGISHVKKVDVTVTHSFFRQSTTSS